MNFRMAAGIQYFRTVFLLFNGTWDRIARGQGYSGAATINRSGRSLNTRLPLPLSICLEIVFPHMGLGYDSSLLQCCRLFLRSRYGEDMQRPDHATRVQRRLPAVCRKSIYTPMQAANRAACSRPRCVCCRQSNSNTRLGTGRVTTSVNFDRILARQTPELQNDTACTTVLGRPRQRGYKAHVARYCGDVSPMQAREGRMLHIRHLRNRRRPTCRIEARKTPRLITHDEITGGKA
jgi:hypothetical protein